MPERRVRATLARALVASVVLSAAVSACGDDASVGHAPAAGTGGRAGSGGGPGGGGASGSKATGGAPAGGESGEAAGGRSGRGGAAGTGAGGMAGRRAESGGSAGMRAGSTGGGESGEGGTPAGGEGGGSTIGGFRWAKVLNAQSHGLVQRGGQLVVASFFGGTPFDPGCGELDSADGALLVASFQEGNGRCQWSPQFSPGGGGMPLTLQVGPDSLLYLGGDFSGPTLDLGGGPLPKLVANWHAPFVGAFSFGPSGLSHEWSTAFTGRGELNGLDYGTGLNVAGTFYQSMSIDGQDPVSCCTSSYGMFAARVEDEDSATWVAGARATSSVSGDRLLTQDVAESGGTVFVTGRIEGPVTFGATQLTPAGYSDTFLAGYDVGNGSLKWVKHWGAPSTHGIGTRLLREPGGTVVLAAVANEGTDFGEGPLVGSQNHLVFARFDTGGDILALESLHVNYGNVFDLARRPNGSIVVFGMFRTPLTLGGVTLTHELQGDQFIAELSSDLASWSHAEAFSTPTEDFMPGRIALTSDGSVALALNFLQWVDARDRHFVATTSWNTLLGVLR